MIYNFVNSVSKLLKGGLSAGQAWVSSVGIVGILTLVIGLIITIERGKKQAKKDEEIKEECKNRIDDFNNKYKEENETLKKELLNTKKQMADMILMVAKDKKVECEALKMISDIYKECSDTYDAEQVVKEKEEQEIKDNEVKEENKQELSQIDTILSDLAK